MRKVSTMVLIAVFAAIGLAAQAMAQEKMAKGASKEARWTGTIVRSDKDSSTLTVRKRGTNVEKIVHYDASTKWTRQEAKEVKPIEMSEVKDGDRVICLGSYDEKGEFHAARIDLRKPK